MVKIKNRDEIKNLIKKHKNYGKMSVLEIVNGLINGVIDSHQHWREQDIIEMLAEEDMKIGNEIAIPEADAVVTPQQVAEADGKITEEEIKLMTKKELLDIASKKGLSVSQLSSKKSIADEISKSISV
jgi:hypothetical protein